MKFTVQQLESIFENWEDAREFYCDPEGNWDIPEIGNVEVKELETDRDDDAIWKVFSIEGRYFQKSGTYSSWDGTYWDGGLIEVEPYQELTTYYRQI